MQLGWRSATDLAAPRDDDTVLASGWWPADKHVGPDAGR